MKVIIVGGGIMGLSIAVELRKRDPVEVLVLEKALPGAEASTAAAGMLAPQFEADKPGPMLDLSLLSRAAWPRFAAEVQQLSDGVDVGYRPCGGLQVAFTDDEVHALDARVAWQQALQLRASLLSSAELRAREPQLSDRALAAADLPDDHQVDPRRLLPALAVAATRLGVQFRAGTVNGLEQTGERVTGVRVDGEVLSADVVVLAAGAWSGLVPGGPLDGAQVKPMRGQMAELQLRAPVVQRLLKSARGYVVPRPDGRVVIGSTMEMVGFDKSVTAAGLTRLLTAAIELVPALEQATVVQSWAGLRPWTADQLPFIGEGPLPGLLLATGHFRNGILLAPITARLVGQLIRQERVTLDVRPFRYHRAQG